MTEQEIGRNIPNGAAYYRHGRTGSPVYYKKDGSAIVMWCHNRWIQTGRCDFENLKPITQNT